MEINSFARNIAGRTGYPGIVLLATTEHSSISPPPSDPAGEDLVYVLFLLLFEQQARTLQAEITSEGHSE